MNRKELVRRIANVMRENDIRKPVSSQKQVFHISDDEGNSKDFVVKKTDKGVLFTYDDVEAVMDTCLAVIGDSLKRGESVSIRGFGTLSLNYRKPRVNKHPVNHIKKYVFTWFGHVCKMLGVKNGYTRMYEEEINRLRVEKPEYEDEDDETLLVDAYSESQDGDE